MATKLPKVPFKAGDDFVLTFTVTNKSSEQALAADTAVIEAQALFDAEQAKTNPDEILLETLREALETAKEEYEEAILVDITDWEISSSLRWITKLVATFQVIKDDPLTGKFSIHAPAEETQNWKPRIYDTDIQFEIDNRRISSQTFQIDVKKDITFEEIVGP